MSITPGFLKGLPPPSKGTRQVSLRLYIFVLIVLIFVAEMLSMGFLYFVDIQNYLVASLLDGAIMILLIIPGLYYLQFIPFKKQIEVRSRAESALRSNEKLLRKVLELMPVGVGITDKDGNFIHTNLAGQSIWGGPRDGGIEQYDQYKGWWAGTGRRIGPKEWGSARAIERGETSIEEEIEIVTFDGSRKTILNSAVPILDEKDLIQGAIIVNQDITQRIKAEKDLLRNNELLERIFFSIDTLIAYMDRNFNFIRVNETYAKSAGHPVEFFIGKNHFDLYPHEENLEIFQRVAESGEPFSVFEKAFEYVEFPERGVTYWDWSLQPVKGTNGAVEGLLLSLVDVTERKVAELRLERQNKELLELSNSERRQRELAESLVRATIAVSTSLELDQVLNSILEQIRKAIPFQGAGIILLDQDTLRLACNLGFERYPDSIQRIEGLTAIDEIPIVQQVLESLLPVFSASMDESPYRQRVPGLEWVQSFVSVPLILEKRVTGIIHLVDDHPESFTQEDVDRLVGFAAPAALAIHNASLYQAEADARQATETLSAAAQALTQTLDLGQVVHTLLDHLHRIIHSEIAGARIFEDGFQLAARVVRGYDRWAGRDDIPSLSAEEITDSILQRLAATRKSLIISNLDINPVQVYGSDVKPITSWLIVPIVANDKLIGLVELGKEPSRLFTPKNLQWAEALVGQAAVAIQNAFLFEQVCSSSDRLQSLARKLVEVQENERRYIARELHDEAGQVLSSLKITLGRLEQDPDCPPHISERLKELKSVADCVLEDLHRLAMDLRPVTLDQLGLVVALEQIASKANSKQLAVRFKAIGFSGERFSPSIETSLYRIVQEALTNTIRYACATNVGILLERGAGTLRLFIEDDGVGFDPDQVLKGTRLGLIGMRERAEMLGGSLTVESSPGSGTSIIVEVPDVYSNPDHG